MYNRYRSVPKTEKAACFCGLRSFVHDQQSDIHYCLEHWGQALHYDMPEYIKMEVTK